MLLAAHTLSLKSHANKLIRPKYGVNLKTSPTRTTYLDKFLERHRLCVTSRGIMWNHYMINIDKCGEPKQNMFQLAKSV